MHRLVPPPGLWASGSVLVITRVMLGMFWLSSLPPKLPVGSSCDSAPVGTLCAGMDSMAQHSMISMHASVIDNVVMPNYRLFALLTINLEWLAGTLLLLGFCTRLGALLGLMQSLNLLVGLGGAPNEWIWSYLLMMTLHVTILAHQTHFFSLDAVLRSLSHFDLLNTARRFSVRNRVSEPGLMRLYSITHSERTTA